MRPLLLLESTSVVIKVKSDSTNQDHKVITIHKRGNTVTCHIDVVSYGHGVNYLLNAYIITLAYSRDVSARLTCRLQNDIKKMLTIRQQCRVLFLSDCRYSLNPLSQTRID